MNSCSSFIVEKFLENLADRIGPQRYKVWFATLARVELTDHTVDVTVPNNFVGNWIQSHYSDLMVQIADKVVGHPCSLKMNVAGETTKLPLGKNSQAKPKSSTPPKKSKPRMSGPGPSRPRDNYLRFSLDDFVVGPSNQLAFSMAQSVVSQQKVLFNPLFIHGSCGLGKTHLAQGICNALRASRPSAKCIYISGEEFTNQFIIALKNNRVAGFRQRFRQADILAIDDIHFLANKRATQEEFLHTFNAIETQGRQIVLASDTHPKLLGSVIESLISRFLAGMVVSIEAPDYQTRLAILHRRSERLGLDPDKAVLEYVARHVRGNVRELEGALLKIKAYAGLVRQQISLSMAAHVLSDYLNMAPGPVGIDSLQQIVAAYFGLAAADLQSARRTGLLTLARSLAVYLARQHCGMSFPEIGRAFGRRSHASAISACKKIKRFLEEKKVLEWTTAGGRTERHNVVEVISSLSEKITRTT